jgi:acetyltransferase-like isoleucine patch superfamily enzyme
MLLKIIKNFLINRSFENKIAYLRKRGCKIGATTRLLCNVNAFGSEPYLVDVGEDCLFSNNVNLFTHDGGVKVLNSLGFFDGKSMDKFGKIKIGNNCFIGNGVKILPGVSIGDNVIIGTGSIVTRDIPSNSVAVGVPAKVLCTIEEYYKNNLHRFYNTTDMDMNQKKAFIQKEFENQSTSGSDKS